MLRFVVSHDRGVSPQPGRAETHVTQFGRHAPAVGEQPLRQVVWKMLITVGGHPVQGNVPGSGVSF